MAKHPGAPLPLYYLFPFVVIYPYNKVPYSRTEDSAPSSPQDTRFRKPGICFMFYTQSVKRRPQYDAVKRVVLRERATLGENGRQGSS